MLRSEKLRLADWGIVAAVVAVFVALAVGIHVIEHPAHVTDCGFDSQGAYAKVRVNNLLGGDNYQKVFVNFSVHGHGLATSSTRVHLPAHGHGAGVVHEPYFPPSTLHIKGRTVYVLDPGNEHPRFVTKKVALERHLRGVWIETVPDDPSVLNCSITGDGGD